MPDPEGTTHPGDPPADSKRADVSGSGFSYIALHDRAAASEYLRAVASSLEEGVIILTSGDREFRAVPDGLVRVRIEAGRSEEAVFVTMRLSWTEDALSPGSAPPLSIGEPR